MVYTLNSSITNVCHQGKLTVVFHLIKSCVVISSPQRQREGVHAIFAFGGKVEWRLEIAARSGAVFSKVVCNTERLVESNRSGINLAVQNSTLNSREKAPLLVPEKAGWRDECIVLKALASNICSRLHHMIYLLDEGM